MSTQQERQRRWRLVLGGESDGTGCNLVGEDVQLDQCLADLYTAQRSAGLGSSAPKVARWLGDIRKYFPSNVVQVLQKDALSRLNLTQLLSEPELLQGMTPNIHLATQLMSLRGVLPEAVRETARMVVRQVVEEVQRRLSQPLRQAVHGSLNRASRNFRPRHREIDWGRTIRANLQHYQAEYNSIIPQTLHGYGRRRNSLRDVILCVDQSGSMAASVVYAGIFGAVLSSLPSLSTRLVVFDTEVVDLSEDMTDPVDLLFGIQLGGGTDINKAIGYVQSQISRPSDTTLILISDLYEGGNEKELIARVRQVVQAGVQVIALLALSDEGKPSYDHNMAAQFAALGVPAFACTPDAFPDLIAAALQKQDIGLWVAAQDWATATPVSDNSSN